MRYNLPAARSISSRRVIRSNTLSRLIYAKKKRKKETKRIVRCYCFRWIGFRTMFRRDLDLYARPSFWVIRIIKKLSSFKTHRYKRKLRLSRKNCSDDANLISLRFLTARGKGSLFGGNPRWEPIQNSADQR